MFALFPELSMAETLLVPLVLVVLVRLALFWSSRNTNKPKFLSYPVAGMSGGEKFDGISVG